MAAPPEYVEWTYGPNPDNKPLEKIKVADSCMAALLHEHASSLADPVPGSAPPPTNELPCISAIVTKYFQDTDTVVHNVVTEWQLYTRILSFFEELDLPIHTIFLNNLNAHYIARRKKATPHHTHQQINVDLLYAGGPAPNLKKPSVLAQKFKELDSALAGINHWAKENDAIMGDSIRIMKEMVLADIGSLKRDIGLRVDNNKGGMKDKAAVAGEGSGAGSKAVAKTETEAGAKAEKKSKGRTKRGNRKKSNARP